MATKKRKAKGRRRSQASKRTRKLVKAIGKAAVKSAGRAVKAGATRVAERVTRETVVRQASRDYWKNDYPDPSKPPALEMKQAENERYEATFDGLLLVPFAIWSHSDIPVEDAAILAAEQIHGPIAATWSLTTIEPVNDAARAVLPDGWPASWLARSSSRRGR